MSATSRCPIRGSTSWPAIAKSAKIIPTRLTFVDIAGLVRGASKGEGLGNQFLANIREVDAIAHVLRCFEDGDITHVEGKIDPLADVETVETELMLADLDSLEKRVDSLAEEGQGRRQGSQGAARRSIEPRAGAAARGQAGARRASASREEERAFAHAAAADLQAGALCLQRRGRLGRDRQRASPTQVAEHAKTEGAVAVVDLGQDRGRDRAAAARASAPNSSRRSASTKPASTA